LRGSGDERLQIQIQIRLPKRIVSVPLRGSGDERVALQNDDGEGLPEVKTAQVKFVVNKRGLRSNKTEDKLPETLS
jgi:hypothetical protein